MPDVFLSLGSNVGDRAGHLQAGIASLDRSESIRVREVSSLYKTAPVGPVPQRDFFNAVARVETGLSPEQLLRTLLGIERSQGRIRTKPWGPRTLDIDIIFMDGVERNTEALKIPHPEALSRAFVLRPLLELAPTAKIGDVSVEAALEAIGVDGVERLAPFERIQTVGILGASANPQRYSHKAQRALEEAGHSVVPFSVREKSILGVPCLASIAEFSGALDTVTVYLSAPRHDSVLDSLIAARPNRVIFNPGSESESSQSRLEQAGIAVEEACTLVLLQTNQF